MIIVSQDERYIYNFENLKMIAVSENMILINDDLASGKGSELGTYKTEERAKEILRDIVIHYKLFPTKEYEMPEK